ncbi:NUDIX hydrolase [Brevibacillus sp. H7]|uniref:NUDIX hydrolase n=1 Tax=Brevibacillus sp. H7 TaxID=3349138 RepID=UPI0038146E81
MRKQVGHRPLILVGATIMVLNSQGEILLQHRSDTNDWGLPGGSMDMGERLEETARRELLEETGLRAEQLQFLEALSGPEWYYRYPNGDEVYNVIILYFAKEVSGSLAMTDGESIGLRYFPLDGLPKLEKRAGLILMSWKDRLPTLVRSP